MRAWRALARAVRERQGGPHGASGVVGEHHRHHLRKDLTVYAQLIRSHTTEQKREEIHRIASKEFIPALRDEPGFVGALHLVNPDCGDAVVIVLWHSAEQQQSTLGGNQTSSLWNVTLRV